MKFKLLLILHLIIATLLFFYTGSYRNWPYKIESDGKYYYQYLISMWYDGDIDFTNNYAIPRPPFMMTEIDHYQFRNLRSASTGRPANWFTTGPAILWSPFFFTTYTLLYGLNKSGLTHLGLDGWHTYFQYMVMYAAVIYSTITLIFIFKLLTLYFDPHIALMASFGLFWATNWGYYSLIEVSLSHTYDLFTLVLFVWVYLSALQRQTTAAYLLAGLLAGLHVLVRTQNLLTVAILFGYYSLEIIIQNRARTEISTLILRKIFIFTTTFLLSLTPLFLTNVYLYGDVFTIPQGSGFFNPFQPAFYGVLFSGRNGLFSHHPLLILGAVGIFLAFINYKTEKVCLRQIVIPLLLVFISQLYLNATVSDWWAGHAFGQRRLISSFLLFAFGLAYIQKYWYKFAPGAKTFVVSVALFFTLMNFYLTYIHLFLWSYDQPHDILHWMFHDAPLLIYVQHFR